MEADQGRLGQIRDDLVVKLWRGQDPFLGFEADAFPEDRQGWGHTHPYLAATIQELRPKVVAEIGVWKGSSSIVMAQTMQELGIDGVVIAIDTWLGAWDHWVNDEWFASLKFKHGQSMLIKTFMTNVVKSNLQDLILPIQLDSLNASEVFKLFDLSVDVLHLDGAHDYRAVRADLEAWWPIINDGGMIIGDDYYEETYWPGVKQAFDEFFGDLGLGSFEHGGGKCRVRKSCPRRTS